MPASRHNTFKIPCNATPQKGDAILFQASNSENIVSTYINNGWINPGNSTTLDTDGPTNGVLTCYLDSTLYEYEFACFVPGPNH